MFGGDVHIMDRHETLEAADKRGDRAHFGPWVQMVMSSKGIISHIKGHPRATRGSVPLDGKKIDISSLTPTALILIQVSKKASGEGRLPG